MNPASTEIVTAAQATASLTRFDSDSYIEGLDRITSYLARPTHMTPVGRQQIRDIAGGFLVNRLRIADYARHNPAVLDRPVRSPVLVLGLPRTGTTMLSHLLALDQRHRSLLRWEAYDSVPPPAAGALQTDPRCLRMLEADTIAFNTPPEIHLERADLPIECIIPFAHDFRGMMWAAIIDDPDFMRWTLADTGLTALAFHALQLKVLQAHTSNHWVLKAPSYGLYLDAVRSIYPDARLIWAHRDPYRAFASTCSITSAQRRMFMEVDDQALGPSLIDIFHAHVARPLAARDAGEDIFDLHYGRFMREPLAEIERLYDWMGESYPDELRREMQAWLAANPRGKFGQHAYELERFGLSFDDLKPYFSPYVDRCGVEAEGSINT